MFEKERKDTKVINIRLNKVVQLFNSFDPEPFIEKDLDENAKEYIVSFVKEFALDDDVKIVIHLPSSEINNRVTREIKHAMHHYFKYQAKLERDKIRMKLKEGRVSLVIGAVFLTVCMFFSNYLESHPFFISHLIAQGLIIVGWVAMWNPVSIFLYDWWPYNQERKFFEKIAKMKVEIKEFTPKTGGFYS